MLVPVIRKNLKLTPETTETEQSDPPSSSQTTPAKQSPEQKPDNSAQTTQPIPSPEQKTPEKKEPEKKPQTDKLAEPTRPSTSPVSTPPVQPPSQPAKPAETRDRSIYLIQGNNNLVKVNRSLNVSNTPLQDSINALLAGPTPDEIMRGIESFIPEGSRLLSPIKVDGSTAYLNFNQEFRYNTRGSEGCTAQIKQIVWTATEFSNVKDVQLLIEGERVDFLIEGVAIRNPIGR